MMDTLAVPDDTTKPRYAEAFLTERPKDGLDMVQARLKKAKVLNDELAEYFKERAHIEDQYAKSLAKLSKKPFVTDRSALGVFSIVYDLLLNEVNDIAKAHATMAEKIVDEVEKPLRSRMANDPDFNRIRTMEPNIQKHIRDYDERFAKVMKHKKTADKANSKKHDNAGAKLSESHKIMEEVRIAWHRDGPEILERHQTVDENRLQVLKEIVTRFENIQSEQMLKRIEVADSTLSATIAFDVQAEIESFCSARNVVITRMSKSNPADDSGPRDVGMISKAFTIRRRTRTESSWTPSEGARSDNGEFVHDFFGESGPVPSNDSGFKTDSLAIDISGTANDEHSNAASTGSNAPSSPTSIYSSNSTAMRQGQTPKVFVDIEGYTIPPDRTAWTDMSGSQISTDFAEDESDAGSMIGGGRMRVEIKDQAVMQEPSEDASSALTRVVTVLRAKDTIVKKARGRREAARATTLSTNPPELPSGRLSPSSESTQNVSGPSSPISFDFNHRRTSSTSETNVSNPFNSPTPNPFEPAIPITSEEVTMLEPATLHTEVPHVRPQLKAYITENVSVLSKAGQVARAYFTGEISLVYMGPSEPSPSTPLCFRITNVDALERVVPNTSYINPLDKHPGVYTLDVNMFSLAGGLPVVVLKYQARVDQDDESRIVPLIIHPLWKCEDNQTLLVIRYQANHGVHFVAEPDAAASNTVITNLTFLVPVDGEVTNAQSEPSGAWNPERKKMLWHADDIVIPADGGDGGEVKKLLAKFETTTMGTPQAVAVKFTCKGRLLSTVGVVGVGRAELGRTGVNGVVNGEAVVDVVSVEKQVNSHKYVAGP